MIPALIILFFTLASFNSEAGYPTDSVQNLEGKRIYVSNCTRCHNANPTKPGAIGPELFTTPIEVFRTKVPSGTYPPKYNPKRKTRVMPKFPQLKDKTDLIYRYIQTFKVSKINNL